MATLNYMGNLPSRRTRTINELTDQIFEDSLKHKILQAEVYCQILKLLTEKRNLLSKEWGWELIWLATGLLALMKDTAQFQWACNHSRYSTKSTSLMTQTR